MTSKGRITTRYMHPAANTAPGFTTRAAAL
jgi:hypothetical protein